MAVRQGAIESGHGCARGVGDGAMWGLPDLRKIDLAGKEAGKAQLGLTGKIGKDAGLDEQAGKMAREDDGLIKNGIELVDR